jgi:hypothetical protein
MKIWK